MEKATFGAGCFWGVEAAFTKLKGVKSTVVGYMGGTVTNPIYKQVCSGQTGHTEVTQIHFDPAIISFESLLDNFFKIHDPTTLNRQGFDIGKQYRSVIFYHSEKQYCQAIKYKELLEEEKRYKRSLTTEILPAAPFYPAEEYHQMYYNKKDIAS